MGCLDALLEVLFERVFIFRVLGFLFPWFDPDPTPGVVVVLYLLIAVGTGIIGVLTLFKMLSHAQISSANWGWFCACAYFTILTLCYWPPTQE